MTKRARFLAAAVAASSLLVVVPGAQAEVRVGKNYRLNSDLNAFRGKDAPSIGVNPANPNHVVQVANEYLVPTCEGSASFDGGATWSTADQLPVPTAGAGEQPFLPACSTVGDHAGESVFQSLAFGSGQTPESTTVYVAYASRRQAGAGFQAQSIILAKSTNGGRNWSTATVAMPGGPGALTTPPTNFPFYVLPSIAVQRGAGTDGADRIYISANEDTTTGLSANGDAAFVVSNNGGTSFSAPIAVEGPTENVADVSQPAFSADGSRLYVAWRTSGTNASVKIARSDNQGQTFNAPVEVATVNNAAANTANPPGPSPSTGSTFPRIAVAPNGNVYMVYNQGAAPPGPPAGGFTAADHFIPPDSDVYFQRSTNNGAGWSQPKLVNEATPKPGNESPANPASFGVVTQTRHPDLAVSPNGRINIVWQDRRHWYRGCIHTHVLCAEARLGDTYYASSSDNGSNFSANRRISDRSTNNDVGYDYRFATYWAFGPVVAPQGDNGLIVGWMDSRNGSFDSDTQDVMLARVNLNAPATIPQESIQRTDNVATSVRLSNHTYPGGGEGLLQSTFFSRNGARVVIANENDYPSILTGGVLARANLSTVLLGSSSGLSDSVKAEVARLKPAGAYVVGDTSKLSAQVVNDLEAAGVPSGQIQRVAGASDAETAANIATTLDRRTAAEQTANSPAAFNAVAVVNAASPDASAVAGLAAARRLPILFTGKDTLPAATSSVISQLDIDKALVIGSSEWVSDAVMAQLPAGATRLGGADQYATSKSVVAESITRGLPPNIVYMADGSKPLDGALLGPVVGRTTGLMALSKTPLSSTATATVAGMGLTAVTDRAILLQAPVVQPPPPPGGGNYYYPPPPRPVPAFAGCPTSTLNVILGTAGADNRTGTTAGDRIFVFAGNDTVDGLAGNDCLDLGAGNDRGQGGLGTDLVLGGTGTDRVSGSSGNDRLRGNAGNDRLDAGRGNDRVFGDAGNDTLLGGFGNDALLGVSGRDRITGSAGRDRINGGSGRDRISGGSSGDRLSGGSAGDRITGNSGRDQIKGNSGNDRITSRDGQRDRVNCGSGRDTVLADRVDVVSRNCERVSRR